MPEPPKGGLKRGAICSERISHAPCCGKDTKAAGWNDPAAAVRVANANAAIAVGEHINLLEVLAERIAGLCLGDPRVLRVRVAVAKLDIYGGTGIPGIRIERRRKVLRLPYEEV